ncbi:peptidoglycan-associated lipoprotein Pal [Piscinibacter koreensis]|uniref:Peptidoglycan-associated protein n=1 Tax=Piscinibacter koreensis TaxID=2742824 RepID=A0A7Y6NLE0_9BURK|nr:peptidoglycan-associated lipoprotein Pal [Schlegelella koreensis]NUZ05307.1 peptidoglycan-associated lipoprotein Pal [Schlegelella koreensis]
MNTTSLFKLRTLTLAVAAVALAGCSSVKLDDKPPVESRDASATSGAAGGAGSGANVGGANSQSRIASVDLTRNANNDAANSNVPRVVYFDFDSFVVKDDYRPVVEANARLLSQNRQRRVSIEGHTDERGGREYNLALGQKRAEAVARSLQLLGVPESQVEAVSFGEERPAVQGSDEAAYAKNRRAELNSR